MARTSHVCHIWLSKEDMSQLVMKYLAEEGYASTALEFFKESGTAPDRDIKPGAPVNMPMLSGDIELALHMFVDLYPLILSQNSELLFHVQQQWFIELIRNRKVEEALNFGQEYIAPFFEQKPEFLREIEKTVLLLSFEDPYNCPVQEVRELMSISHLLKTAMEVNAAFLTIQNDEEKDDTLSSLLEKLIRVQEQLDQEFYFQIPHI